VATEPLASNVTIRTGAAKIEIDALWAHFRIFDIVGLLIVRREVVPFSSKVAQFVPNRRETVIGATIPPGSNQSIPDTRTNANDQIITATVAIAPRGFKHSRRSSSGSSRNDGCYPALLCGALDRPGFFFALRC
jgi:hypothetical protein